MEFESKNVGISHTPGKDKNVTQFDQRINVIIAWLRDKVN